MPYVSLVTHTLHNIWTCRACLPLRMMAIAPAASKRRRVLYFTSRLTPISIRSLSLGTGNGLLGCTFFVVLWHLASRRCSQIATSIWSLVCTTNRTRWAHSSGHPMIIPSRFFAGTPVSNIATSSGGGRGLVLNLLRSVTGEPSSEPRRCSPELPGSCSTSPEPPALSHHRRRPARSPCKTRRAASVHQGWTGPAGGAMNPVL